MDNITHIVLAIVGGRDYTDYNRFEEIVDKYILEEFGPLHECCSYLTICSGGARGVDTLAEMYAEKHNIHLKIFYPDWDRIGKRAGLERNTSIVDYATHILALPTEKSVGTWDTIRKAKSKGKNFTVVRV